MKQTQLRDYTIKPGELQDFVRVWKDGVRPIRQRRGFVIEGAWTIPTEERFVWVVSYDKPDGFEAAVKAYMESPERKALDPDPASFIVTSRIAFIDPV